MSKGRVPGGNPAAKLVTPFPVIPLKAISTPRAMARYRAVEKQPVHTRNSCNIPGNVQKQRSLVADIASATDPCMVVRSAIVLVDAFVHDANDIGESIHPVSSTPDSNATWSRDSNALSAVMTAIVYAPSLPRVAAVRALVAIASFAWWSARVACPSNRHRKGIHPPTRWTSAGCCWLERLADADSGPAAWVRCRGDLQSLCCSWPGRPIVVNLRTACWPGCGPAAIRRPARNRWRRNGRYRANHWDHRAGRHLPGGAVSRPWLQRDGLVRRQNNPRLPTVAQLCPAIEFIESDLLDQSSLIAALEVCQPTEVYNLGAISFVSLSYKQAVLTGEISGLEVTRMLEAIRMVNPKIRFFQASVARCSARSESGRRMS